MNIHRHPFVVLAALVTGLGLSACMVDAEEESIDLRYAAFTSLERAGPTPECVALLRQLSNNETLGPSSRSVLSAWHIQ